MRPALDVALPESVQRITVPLVLLAPNLMELVRVEPLGEATEPSAGIASATASLEQDTHANLARVEAHGARARPCAIGTGSHRADAAERDAQAGEPLARAEAQGLDQPNQR